MRISASSIAGAGGASSPGGASRRAQIKRQIKTLEKKRDKLLQQMSGAGGGGEGDSGSVTPQGTAQITGAQSKVKATISTAAPAPSGDGHQRATGATVNVSERASGDVAILVNVVGRALTSPTPSAEEQEADATLMVDPKELAKIVAMINSQIMALYAELQKLEGEGALPENPDADETTADAIAAAVAMVEAAVAAASPAEPTGDVGQTVNVVV